MSLADVAESGAGIFVRPSDRGRTWQVNMDPDSKIVWSWPETSTSARLVVTSFVENAVSAYDIERSAGADVYEWTRPQPTEPTAEGEYLYDLTLTIYAGETVLQREAARVVYLPSTIRLCTPESAEWKMVPARKGGRIFAYDAAWANASADAATISLAAEGLSSPLLFDLAGISGWEPVSLARRLDPIPDAFTISLAFDEETAYAASLRRKIIGTVVLVR